MSIKFTYKNKAIDLKLKINRDEQILSPIANVF